jgi:hypothetical protein
MRKILIIAAALGLGAAHAEEQRARETFKVGDEATNLISMNVTSLREKYCGGELTEGS